MFRILFTVFITVFSTTAIEVLVVAEPDAAARPRSPWGISSSAGSFRNHEKWFPKMAEAGISTIRLFPEWRGFEPDQGTWHWTDGERLVKSAVDHQLEINAILMVSPPGFKAVHAFPMENVGMNLRYEVADSQGRSPYANVGQWFGVSPESIWQTYTWHCQDACFSKMWGYDFVIAPEQSIPFVIGKVEVSTVPFK